MGKITVKFGLIEELIIDCINILMGIEGASVVTAGLAFSRLLAMLKALYMQKYNIGRDDDLPNYAKEMFSQVTNVNEKRNQFVHSYWHKGKTQDSLERIKRQIDRKGLKIDNEQIDIPKIEDVANYIESVVYLVYKFSLHIRQTVLISPPNGAVISDGKIELVWQEVPNAVAYELLIATSPDFPIPVVNATGSNSIRNTTFKYEATTGENMTYFWRVRPIMPIAPGYWSDIGSFVVQ